MVLVGDLPGRIMARRAERLVFPKRSAVNYVTSRQPCQVSCSMPPLQRVRHAWLRRVQP